MKSSSTTQFDRATAFVRKTAYVTLFGLSLLFIELHDAKADGLFDIYQQAVAYDAELKAAEYEFEAIKQTVPLSRAPLRPQASIGGSVGYNDISPDGSNNFTSQVLTLNISQTLFNYSSMLAVDTAKLTVMQAEANLEAQRQALMLRVATAYFNVLKAQADLLFRRSELDAIGRQKEQNERRFEVGLVPITDVKDAQAQFDLATAQSIAAENQLSTAEEALIVISGADPKTLKTLSGDAPLATPDPADINAWVKIAEEQNIPLVVAKLNAQRATEQTRVFRAERYPTLDLVGQGRMSDTEQRSGRDVNSGEVRLELNLPLLTGGQTKASIAQSRMEALAAGQQLTSQRRATVQTTRDAYRSVVADVSRVNALKQALASTQKSLEAQEAGFAEGLLTSLEVLRSLRDTFSAQSNYSAARYDYILNSLNLKQAVGILHESDLENIDRWLVDKQ